MSLAGAEFEDELLVGCFAVLFAGLSSPHPAIRKTISVNASVIINLDLILCIKLFVTLPVEGDFFPCAIDKDVLDVGEEFVDDEIEGSVYEFFLGFIMCFVGCCSNVECFSLLFVIVCHAKIFVIGSNNREFPARIFG